MLMLFRDEEYEQLKEMAAALHKEFEEACQMVEQLDIQLEAKISNEDENVPIDESFEKLE